MLSQVPRHILRSQATQSLIVARRSASHGAPHYNEPTGNIFGEPTLTPGGKRKWEWWEPIWYFGIYGGMALAAVGLYFKPDSSIKTWALNEAKARMEARGEPTDYTSYKVSKGSSV